MEPHVVHRFDLTGWEAGTVSTATITCQGCPQVREIRTAKPREVFEAELVVFNQTGEPVEVEES